MVDFAKTATIRARDPVGDVGYMQKRMDYLDYVAAAPRPSAGVIEDKDEQPAASFSLMPRLDQLSQDDSKFLASTPVAVRTQSLAVVLSPLASRDKD